MPGRAPHTFAVFGFATTHDALHAEALFEARAFPVVPIPTPQVLGAKCGIALRVPMSERDAARALLEHARIEGVSEGIIEDI